MVRAPLVLSLLAALALAPGAGAAASLRFSAAPSKIWQDQQATVAIAVRPAGVRCTLTVRYADGSTQKGLAAVRAVNGKARWTWKVPLTADAGAARLTAWCKGVGKLTRTVVVIGATGVRAKVVVGETGFTQRPDRACCGSAVSYGIMLRNPDVAYDAVSIGVLVNFLNADGRILGSKSDRVAGVAAGSEYSLGGWIHLGTQTAVTRLEIVLITSSRAPRTLHFPSTTAIGFEQALGDPGWVGAVAGELVNDNARMTLTRAKLSVIVRGVDGAILGGSTAYVTVSLLPGTRVLWRALTGLKPIRIEQASSAQVSIEPSWVAPGA